MAFQTGTATTIQDLLQQLSTFLQANGWTENYANVGDPGTIAFSKNSVFVSFQYSETGSGTGTMAMYQATAADASPTTDPWTSTGDSGSGRRDNIINNFDNARCVNVFAGPHTSYFFFENNASPAYCHVVVEVDPGRYRHFGFGEIIKIGDWIGGEYCYGHFWGQAVADIDNVFDTVHVVGLDAIAVGNAFYGTMRVDGFPNEPDPLTIWAAFGAQSAGNDTAGNPRWRTLGPWRNGRLLNQVAFFRISPATAYSPLVPMAIELFNPVPAPDQVYRVGFQADVRHCNIGNIEPGQIINIAGDSWYFFPLTKKQNLQNDTEESKNAGVAYRRIDA